MLDQPGFSVSAGNDLAWTAHEPPPDDWASAFPLDPPTEVDVPDTVVPVIERSWDTPSGYTGDRPDLVDGPFDGIGDFFEGIFGDMGGLLATIGPTIASVIGGWPIALATVLGFKLLKNWQQRQPAPVTFATYAAPAGQAQQVANYFAASGVRVGQIDQNSNAVTIPVYHRGLADRAAAAYNARVGEGAQITRVGA